MEAGAPEPARGRGRWWFGRRGRRVALAFGVVALLVVGGLVAVYVKTGWYGLNVMVRRGMTTWSPTGPDDPRLSPGMRLALSGRVPDAAAGPLTWRQAAPGFELGELPVMVDGVEVDRLLLSRIDPARYRFQVRSRSAGDREIGDWMRATGAVLAVNGAFFAVNGEPDTPILSDGVRRGPAVYQASHGAFVARAGGAAVRDLTGVSWQQAFTGASDALVSYPMLIGADGRSRAGHTGAEQLANRSFVGQDARGAIVIGTSTDAFFSLGRLADFLRVAPLGLRLALNLDGGPIACQAVRLPGASRDFCGRWETALHDGKVELLGSLFGSRRAGLPLVLTATPAG